MGWFFISRVVAAMIAVATLLVLTRVLQPADFGRYNIVILAGTLLQSLLFTWLVTSVTRFHSAPESSGRVLPMAATAALLTFLLPVLLLVFGLVALPAMGVAVAALALAAALGLHEFALAGLRVQRRGPIFALTSVGRPLVGTTLAVALVLAGGGYAAAVWATVAGAALAGVLGLSAVIRRSGLQRPSKAMLWSFFAFGQPLAFIRSGTTFLALTSQYIVATMVSLEQVGLFSAAQTLAQRSITMLMVTVSLTTAASIFEAQEVGEDGQTAAELRSHLSMLLLVAAPLLAVFCFAKDTVARVVFDEGFGPGVGSYLAILSVAAFFNGLQAAFLAFSFSLKKQTLFQLGLTLALAAIHIVVTWAATATFSGRGAAWAALATAVLSAALYAWYGRAMFRGWAPLELFMKMGVAMLAAAPFLVVADQSEALPTAVSLVGLGMATMLGALRLLRYPGLEVILAALRRRGALS